MNAPSPAGDGRGCGHALPTTPKGPTPGRSPPAGRDGNGSQSLNRFAPIVEPIFINSTETKFP